jgi:hypothetical protein
MSGPSCGLVDLSTNRGSESASGAKVAAARARKGSSRAGAKPELPVCGQVGGAALDCPCSSRDGVCVGQRRGCPFVDEFGTFLSRAESTGDGFAGAAAAAAAKRAPWFI